MMKYEVLVPLKAKTKEGVVELSPGQIINMEAEKARKVIEKGKIRPFNGNSAYPLLDAALSRISKTMPSGFNFPWVKRHHRAIYEQYMAKERAQEEAYLRVKDGADSLEVFERSLNEWVEFSFYLFDIYENAIENGE